MSTANPALHILPLDQPVVCLEATSAFNGLTDKEKLYAFHLSNAAWTGGLITLLQTSVESGPLFTILHKIYKAQKPSDIRTAALSAGFTVDEINALFVYSSGVFSNAGNYKGFGDTKFIPGIEQQRLEKLLKLNPAWSTIQPLWKLLKDSIYDLGPGKTCLGYPPLGTTTYLTKNCTDADNKNVQNWMSKKGYECYNTRCFKTNENGKTVYEIRLAGGDVKEIEKEEDAGHVYKLTSGDYTFLLAQVAEHLKKAVQHAANQTQVDMLNEYTKSFATGSLQAHKDGSRLWIKDKSPAIESYIGFIETYRDPAGVRGEFEGFVSAVNREMSVKFTTLVENAERLLPLLPWSKLFEKDKFLRPDFTSLDVLTFAGSGIPAGINIPNYDEIRQSEGFKNVSLGNVIPASFQLTKVPFLNDVDKELFQKYRVKCFEVQVGLHELLGHGSGKLLQKEKNGSLNYPSDLLDPLTGKPVASHYEPGDTYDSKFGPLSSAYEECRAEAVGLFLCLHPSIMEIFGHTGKECEDIMYVNWLSLVWSGLFALEVYDAKVGWLQAHSQARFVIMNVLIQAGVVSVTQPTPDDLLITLDRDSFKGAGQVAIGHFLLQLQVYKATANIEAARKLFHHYSDVTEPWLGWQEIVLANKKPRKMFAQPNMVLNGDKVAIKSYDSTHEGLIQSWIERFDDPEPLYDALLSQYKLEGELFQ